MLVHMSYRNLINEEQISAVLYYKGSAVKRLRDSALDRGLLIDGTAGKKTRSVIILTTGQVVLSALNPEILQRRVNKARSGFKRQGSLKNEYREEVWDYEEGSTAMG